MTLRMTGDFAKFDRTIAKLSDSGGVLKAVTKNMSEEAVDLIKEGYRTETDPYGKKWKPKKAKDGRKTLSGKTSRLKGGWSVQRTDGGGFEIEASVDYGEPHQRPKKGRDGKLKRPRRIQIPTYSKGMPAKWKEEILQAGLEAIATAYGK